MRRFVSAQTLRTAFRALAQLKAILSLSMIVLVWGSIHTILVVEHESSLSGAEQNTRNLARVFEEHVVRAIRDTDKTLLFLRSAYEKSPHGFNIQRWVDGEYFRNDLTLQLAIIGADGFLVSTNVGPVTSPMDLSDREHFRVHVNTTNDEIYISKPVLGRATGKWSVQLTRKVIGSDGSFKGVVVASLDPYLFSRFYESVDLGAGGAVTLVGLDGIIRARGGMDASAIGKSAASSAAFELLKISPQGTFLGGGVVDGVRRLVSYRAVGEYPLVVMVGMSENDIFAQYAQWRMPLYAGGCALTVLLLLIAGIGVRHQMRLDEARRDLEIARDNAEAANKAKSAFLAVMSHEMRTPLNGVIGALDLLQRTGLNADQGHYVEAALTSSEALLAQINDVLDFSKMEAGKLSLETSPVEISPLLDTVISIVGPQAKAQGITLSRSIDTRLPERVLADPVRLRQILLNFLSNAVKFTPNGRIGVDVRLFSGSRTSPVIEFSVTDTGVGIPPERLGWLFKEFSMVDASYARNAGGTGLGLAICKRLVTAMGGEIGVESIPSQGSRFWFRLPLPEVAAGQSDPAEVAPASDAFSQPLKVLLVDDNPTNQMVASRMLVAAGHAVDTASDGREALERAARSRYDVILMDISMPEMDGMEATRRIRRLPEPFASVPIIALTANAVAGDRQQFLAAGMTDYMTKPFRRAELETKLSKYEHGGQPAPSSPTNAVGEQLLQVPLIDKRELETLARETCPEMVPEVVRQYLAELSERLAQFEAARRSCQMEDLGRIAHAIAGSAASVGAMRLRQVAKQLELSCRSLNADEVLHLADQIPELAEQTTQGFRDALSTAVAA